MTRSLVFLDPDFGWHLKMGEWILQNGIPKTDPFSYTMPSYSYIEHAWLSDVLLFKLYPIIGNTGLSIIYSLFTILSLLLLVNFKKFHWSIIPLLLSFSIVLPFTGVRTQIVSWLFMAIILRIIFYFQHQRKWWFTLPLVFLAWVNLHGSFALGLIILLLDLFLSLFFWVKNSFLKNFFLFKLAVFISCLIAITINPYGLRIMGEVWGTVSSNDLHWQIGEWLPIFLKTDFAFVMLTALSVLLLTRYRAKLTILVISLFIISLLMTLSSQRQAFFYALTAIPVTAKGLEFLHQEVSKIKFGFQRFGKLFLFVSLITVGVFIFQNTQYLKQASFYSEKNYYPKEAIQFLKQQNIEGEIYAPYEWGGYLDWNFPQKKVFIDGRMAIWTDLKASSSESSNAFEDYNNFIDDSLIRNKLIKKYNVTYILWRKTPPPINRKNRVDWRDPTSLLGPVNTKENFFTNIEEEGWEKIYQDQNSLIYSKVTEYLN